MILTFTDFGVAGPYRGQLNTVLATLAPGVPSVELMCDAPRFDPRASAYLLAALVDRIPTGSVVVAVVDPGVGGSRVPLAVHADEIWYVGPDNGLLDQVCARAKAPRVWRIDWRPKVLSASFHGRDLFAPVAARLSTRAQCIGEFGPETGYVSRNWPQDLWEVVYVDGYGNCMTGIRAVALTVGDVLQVGSRSIAYAETFSAVSRGTPLWYRNSLGLVEIATHCGSAAEQLGLRVGSPIARG